MSEDSTLVESPAKYVKWNLTNFFDLPTDDNFFIDSPHFTFSDATWKLRIYTNGEEEDNSVGRITLYLFKEKSILKYNIAYRVGINYPEGSEFVVYGNTHLYPEISYMWGHDLVESSTLLGSNDIVPDGTLTVFCLIRIENQLSKLSKAEVPSLTSQLNCEDSVLAEDFKNMYITGLHTDTTLLVKNETFKVHRSVLAARSEVFASMFQHEMLEKTSGKVEISDCDPGSFEDFLLFLYSGMLDSLPMSKAVNLYKTAEKYDVKALKLKCVDIMLCDLCVDSFCDVIHLATMHSETDLLRAATDFFIEHIETILSTAKWIQFMEENAVLSNELVMRFVKSKNLDKD